MAFKDALGHEKPIELLERSIRNDKVVHSYLFTGSEGIGKKWVALQFAKALNCLDRSKETGDACDHCLSCRKIDDHLHPDVLLVEPEGQAIRIDQVRQMQKDLAYQPYEGRRRVCILTAADRMAANMSNALLKTLEEPPLHTVIVLLAKNPRLLLPTILSRCQQVRFHPLSIPVVTRWLMREQGLQEEEARLLASLSEGSPGKALDLREKVEQIHRKSLLTGWVGVKSLSFGKIAQISESLPTQREHLGLVLEVVKTLLRDLVALRVAKNESTLIHLDLKQDMEMLASDWSLHSLLKRIETLHQTLMDISPLTGNANTTLALEAMMLSWAEG